MTYGWENARFAKYKYTEIEKKLGGWSRGWGSVVTDQLYCRKIKKRGI